MWYLITKPDCEWCDKAKEFITERGEGFVAFSYDDHPMILKLMMFAGLKSVPQIWCGTEYVGGYTDLVKWTEDA